MTWVDILGYAASAAVLATFCMSTMIPLRILALGSNVLFMAYGYADHLYPVFIILHAILLPVNAPRLIQFRRLVRDRRDAHQEDLSIQSLLPYMKRRKFAAGETSVRKGDKANRLRTDCSVFELTEHKAKELYFQDRSFGFAVLQFVIACPVENNDRLMQARTT